MADPIVKPLDGSRDLGSRPAPRGTTAVRRVADDDVLVRIGPFGVLQPDGTRTVTKPPSGLDSVYDLAGWTSVRVLRSCESFPSIFEVTITEKFPGDNRNASVSPGDPIQVLFTRGYGTDVVCTGYIDRVEPSLSADQHSVTIVGRGKCADLLDSANALPTGQFNNTTVAGIARKLVEPFATTLGGIKVVTDRAAGAADDVIPQLMLSWGESPYEAIERVARYVGLLVYEDGNGDLVLARGADTSVEGRAAAASAHHATGIAEGENVLRATATYRMDQRYSEYVVRRLTFDTLGDVAKDPEGDILYKVPDQAVGRFRPLSIIAEIPKGMGLNFAKRRGEWEASRRYGRSAAIHVTVDSWRDGDGVLWTPNATVDVYLPTLKRGAAPAVQPTSGTSTPGKPAAATKWVIATVTFRRDGETGTTADLLLMPSEAFTILPLPLVPLVNTGPNIPTTQPQ